ncbi:MAG: DsbA family protein [Minisyncoccia bacterium]
MSLDWKKYWPLVVTILLVALLVGIGKTQTSFLGISFHPGQKVAQKTIDFINTKLLQGQTATLGEVKEVSGVYEFKLKLGTQEYTSFVTKDGKYLFTSGIDMTPSTSTPSTTSAAAAAPKQTCADLAKTETPILEAFVVAKCPFGLQMERILGEIVKNIPEAAKYIKVEYMGSIVNGKAQSMHDSAPGGEEATENMRQVCLREEQPNTFWNYVNCHIQKGEVNPCLTQAEVDVNKLNSCLTDSNKGLAYIKKDFENQDKYGVTGSPTLILNSKTVSEFDFGGRTAEAVKTVLCCGFKNQPSFCSQKLTTEQAATSFSPTYSTGGSANSGSCN